jgi:SAM-dependent methyltransferase
MKLENWSPERDPYLKPGERELHAFLHASRASKVGDWESILRNKGRRWRQLEAAVAKCGGVRGTVLEVGAGDGWCSAALLKHYPEVDSAYIVEVDEAAVGTLIPDTLRAFEVHDRDITLVLGSFNAIPYDGFFDLVVAMGALHHSENLFVTLRSIWKALKPGGRLFSQEPAMADSTPNAYYTARSGQIAKFSEGFQMLNSERSDVFYRRCEYLAALYHAGFDVVIDDLPPTHPTPAVPAGDAMAAPATDGGKKKGLSRLFGSAMARVAGKRQAESQPPPTGAPANPAPETPFNVFITATKPLHPEQALPLTAWENP